MIVCLGMYSCWAAGSRVNISRPAKYVLIGLLHPLFCVMYELTGVNNEWFHWGMKEPALRERIFNVPVMAVAFHFAFGISFSFVWDYSPQILRFFGVKSTSGYVGFMAQIVVVFLITPLLALLSDIPTHVLERYGGVSRVVTLLVMLSLSKLYVIISFITTTSPLPSSRIQQVVSSTASKASKYDFLLLSIPILYIGFIVWKIISVVTVEGHMQLQPYTTVVLADAALAVVVFSWCCCCSSSSCSLGNTHKQA